MRVYLGNDHGGAAVKRAIIDLLDQMGIEYVDFGSEDEVIVRYPYYAAEVAAAVSRGDADRGILICSTGIGMSIVANKYPGVRAALCHSSYDAKMTRKHNDSNILCLGGKTVGIFEILDMVEIWLSTEYIGGRHDISLGLIREVERANFSGKAWVGPKEGRL